jgi:hypothetical protein
MASQQQQTANLPALTPAGAIDNIKEKFPNEAAILAAVVKNNVLALGTDEVFALRDAEGEIKAFKRTLLFSDKEGTLIQPVPSGPFVISAQGYEYWSENVGANVIMPPEVLVDGVYQQNPYVIRDPQNRRILAIYCRAVAFRFSPMGLPMVSDWTTIFDNPSYRLIDLLAKAKNKPQAFKLLPIGMQPPDDEKSTWTSYPFDESTNLWVNTSHEEALTWYSQILNREKKSIDFAQTFARRNALKHLSGLQKSPTGNTWKVTVTAWRATSGNIVKWDSTHYGALREKAQKLASGDRREFKQIESHSSGIERVENDDITDFDGEGEAYDVTPTTAAPVSTAGQPPPNVRPLNEDELRLINNLKVAKEQFRDEYTAACLEIGIEPDADHSPGMAAQLMKIINRIVDSAAQ